MGWSSGSSLLSSVWGVVRKHTPKQLHVSVLLELMMRFADEDCDTLDEIVRDDWPETQTAYDIYIARRGNRHA